MFVHIGDLDKENVAFAPMARHRKGVLLFTSAALCLFIWQRESLGNTETIYKFRVPPEISNTVSEFNSCLLSKFSPLSPKKLWTSLGKSVGQCLPHSPLQKIEIDEYPNGEEKKWHVRVSSGQESVVTIGVGRDIQAEQLLINDSSIPPVFFGADPIYDRNDIIYSSIGTFFPFAVGGDTGLFDSNVYINGSYMFLPVVQMSLPLFLRGFVHRSTIDVLWMDAEGGEFAMMEMLHEDGALDREGLTLCQIQMEAHQPHAEREILLQDFIFRLLKEQKYVLLRASGTVDLRLFLLNISNENCLRRFVFQHFELSQ